MLNFKKLFICLMFAFLLTSSFVLATDTVLQINEENATLLANDLKDTSVTAQEIEEDLFIYNTDSYTLSDNVNGNVFSSTLKFVTNPRNNGGNISGNLFLISSEVTIGSDISYSDVKDKNGNYLISSINSSSTIEGNAYVFSENFTLESGSKIEGDLYIYSTNVNICQDTLIEGNVFIFGTNVTLNGQVSGSAYVTTQNFNMSYLGYVSRDLSLNSTNANLDGVIVRNAYITVSNDLSTTSYFRVDQNLFVDYANNFTFGGEVKKNARINVKNLGFNNGTNDICIIKGNLEYSTESNITVPDEIVSGEIKSTQFRKLVENKFSIQDAILSCITLIIYVFAIVFVSKRFASNAIKSLSIINLKNVLISVIISFGATFAVFILFVLLLVSSVGLPLSFLLVIAYLFAMGISLPLFLQDISSFIKLNINEYIKLLITTIVFYLISLIPVLGSTVVFISLFASTGRILQSFLKQK